MGVHCDNEYTLYNYNYLQTHPSRGQPEPDGTRTIVGFVVCAPHLVVVIMETFFHLLYMYNEIGICSKF